MRVFWRIFWAILWGGLVAGTLDILSAFASYVPHGATELGILKYVASGLIGPGAMKGGDAVALLGLGVHFGLTTIMAAVFVAAAIKLPWLLARPWLWGCAYGLLTYVLMVYIIVPHSGALGWKLPVGWDIVSGLWAHFFFVGTPIAHIAKHFLQEPASER
jgi:hypothetical protein